MRCLQTDTLRDALRSLLAGLAGLRAVMVRFTQTAAHESPMRPVESPMRLVGERHEGCLTAGVMGVGPHAELCPRIERSSGRSPIGRRRYPSYASK
jgi:hypothetical protein